MSGENDEAVAEILSKLAIAPEEERTEILESILPILSSASGRAKYKEYLEQHGNLEIVFDCVNASKNLQVVINVITNILDFLDPAVILEKYSKSLQRCLDHPDVGVRRMILHFLRGCQNWEQSKVMTLAGMKGLIISVVKALIDEDLGVSKEAKLTIHTLARDHQFGLMMFEPPINDLLNEMSKNPNETLRMRLYDCVVLIAKMAPEYANKSTELLQSLCKELDSTDFLLQLNVLELLWDLAESQHGYQYLHDQGVLRNLDQLLDQVSSSPLASLLMPGFIKFFGE